MKTRSKQRVEFIHHIGLPNGHLRKCFAKTTKKEHIVKQFSVCNNPLIKKNDIKNEPTKTTIMMSRPTLIIHHPTRPTLIIPKMSSMVVEPMEETVRYQTKKTRTNHALCCVS